jgi:hypothetical protein
MPSINHFDPPDFCLPENDEFTFEVEMPTGKDKRLLCKAKVTRHCKLQFLSYLNCMRKTLYL